MMRSARNPPSILGSSYTTSMEFGAQHELPGALAQTQEPSHRPFKQAEAQHPMHAASTTMRDTRSSLSMSSHPWRLGALARAFPPTHCHPIRSSACAPRRASSLKLTTANPDACSEWPPHPAALPIALYTEERVPADALLEAGRVRIRCERAPLRCIRVRRGTKEDVPTN
jgi:hypothetical protein